MPKNGLMIYYICSQCRKKELGLLVRQFHVSVLIFEKTSSLHIKLYRMFLDIAIHENEPYLHLGKNWSLIDPVEFLQIQSSPASFRIPQQ